MQQPTLLLLNDVSLVLANHATDPLPISKTIRKCASEFKKVRLYVTMMCVSGPITYRLTCRLVVSFTDASGTFRGAHVHVRTTNQFASRTLGTKISSRSTMTNYRVCPPCSSAHRTVRDNLRPAANQNLLTPFALRADA